MTVEAGAEVPALPLVAGSLLIAGVLLLVLGGALIALPISRTAGSRSEVRTV